MVIDYIDVLVLLCDMMSCGTVLHSIGIIYRIL